MRSSLALAALLAAVTAAGCGAEPPQAPLAYAQKLDSATSGISTACGDAYRVTAFAGNHRRDLQQLETTASGDVRKLATVFKRNPEWVYQGQKVRQIVGAGEQMLSACGLHTAARELQRATASS